MTNELNQISLLIVDDEALIAEDIRDICILEGYGITEVCYNAGRALHCINNNEIDLAILDINLDDELSGIDLAKYINEKKLNIPFVFLTSYSDKTTLNLAKDTRPMGYVTKPFHKEQLISTIEIALGNFQSFRFNSSIEFDKLQSKLKLQFTDREMEVLQLIIEGKNNQQIANRAYMSINTVKYHIKNLYDKLDVNSRAQLLAKLRF